MVGFLNIRGLRVADEQQKQTPSKKRRLRTNTETVRERSAKQQQIADMPVRTSFVRTFLYGFTWPVRKLGRAIGKLGRFRVFRVIGRILLPKYVRNSWRELRMVSWPDRSTTWRLTYAVIVFSIIFGLIVAGVDFVLNKVFKEIILK